MRTVYKRDGREEPFDRSKIERWSSYVLGEGKWDEFVNEVVSRLPSKVSSQEIHSTMINICLEAGNDHLLMAASKLVYASLRKNMINILGVDDKVDFEILMDKYEALGLWSGISEIYETNPAEVERWYKDLYDNNFKYHQVVQWVDKYSVKYLDEGKDIPIETPHVGAIGIALALFGVTDEGFAFAKHVIEGRINLPTPVLNGVRNGDYDNASCLVISGGDSIESIGVAEHVAYRMTAKKAGIGIEIKTRSKGDPVKGGRIKHLGKQPIYAAIDKSVKMFTQVGRGGSATVSFSVYDPDIMDLLQLRSQRVSIDVRLDKLDFSMVYDDAFVEAVIDNKDIQTMSVIGIPGPVYKAQDVLKQFLTIRQETGRVYCFNISTANSHTPFIDTIHLSNLCQEISLPTKPFTDMNDLYSATTSQGELAFCFLSAINVANIESNEQHKEVAYLTVKALNTVIERSTALSPAVARKLKARRSLGIGITGLAVWLADRSLSYNDTDQIEELAERHAYYLYSASIKLAEAGHRAVSGIDRQWLPIDTKSTKKAPVLDWEALRGRPRTNSVLVAHMPTESSALFSDATNGLYPIRRRVINKVSRHGIVRYIAPANILENAWDVGNETLIKMYAAVQAYTDQGISADLYYSPHKMKDGKIAMSTLIREWVMQAKYGLKSLYYSVTNDDNGGSFSSTNLEEESGCDGACTI